MAVTVEDGTGLAAADSYISQAAADTYFTNHNAPTAWTGLTSANKDAALRYATQALDGMYSFVGSIQFRSTPQALAWPRIAAYDEEARLMDDSAVPTRVEEATCELALAHANTALNSAYARGGQVRSEQVAALRVEYMDAAAIEPLVPQIDRIIRGLGILRGNTVELLRG